MRLRFGEKKKGSTLRNSPPPAPPGPCPAPSYYSTLNSTFEGETKCIYRGGAHRLQLQLHVQGVCGLLDAEASALHANRHGEVLLALRLTGQDRMQEEEELGDDYDDDDD